MHMSLSLDLAKENGTLALATSKIYVHVCKQAYTFMSMRTMHNTICTYDFTLAAMYMNDVYASLYVTSLLFLSASDSPTSR